ncbi:MAG: hypothetical protein U0270_39445 [Labilithrix sp.]
MKALFLRAGVALAAALGAIGLGLVAQSMTTLQPYTGLVAVWPTFLLALGLGLFLALKKENDGALAPALGALAPLGFYAFAARQPIAEEGEPYVAVVVCAAPMIGLAGLLVGVLLERLPRVTIGFAVVMTALAGIAISIPSLPRSLWRDHTSRPETSDIHSMSLAGVLVVDGAPVVAHGVSYRLQHDAFDSAWCEVVADSNAPQLANHRARIIYSCRSRALRCDDVQRMCLVEDDDYATGYTYDYEPISIHGFRQADGRVVVRVEAWLLALGAVFLLLRARNSPARHALAMGAFMTASISLGMMLRFVEL